MNVLRRKMGQGKDSAGRGVSGVDRAWRLALARASRDEVGLALEVRGFRDDRASLAELVETAPERSLLAVLDIAGSEGLGLVALDPAVLAGVVGMLATGRVGQPVGSPRRPTRTDAAMVAPMLDAALAGFGAALAGQQGEGWAEGWRYASFIEEARPLSLLLEDTEYRLLRADVSLGSGEVTGQVLLALPAVAAQRPASPVPFEVAERRDEAFRAAFERQVEAAACRIEADLVRCSLPLSLALGLSVGDVLPLGDADVARLVLRGVDGQALGEGKLGQMRGQRAVRLVQPQAEALRLTG